MITIQLEILLNKPLLKLNAKLVNELHFEEYWNETPRKGYSIESKLDVYKELINFRQLINEINILDSYSEASGFKNYLKMN